MILSTGERERVAAGRVRADVHPDFTCLLDLRNPLIINVLGPMPRLGILVARTGSPLHRRRAAGRGSKRLRTHENGVSLPCCPPSP